MESRRFFVTLFSVLGIVAFTTGCPNRARENAGQQAQDKRTAFIAEGNEKVKQYVDLEAELTSAYKLNFAKTHKEIINSKFDFMSVSKAQRREIAGKIARLLQIVNRLIEIDAQKNITIDNRESLYASRDSAELYQKAIESFEAKNGENFDPKPMSPRLSDNN